MCTFPISLRHPLTVILNGFPNVSLHATGIPLWFGLHELHLGHLGKEKPFNFAPQSWWCGRNRDAAVACMEEPRLCLGQALLSGRAAAGCFPVLRQVIRASPLQAAEGPAASINDVKLHRKPREEQPEWLAWSTTLPCGRTNYFL